MTEKTSISYRLNAILELEEIKDYNPQIRFFQGGTYIYGIRNHIFRFKNWIYELQEPEHFRAPSCVVDIVQHESESHFACLCSDGSLYSETPSAEPKEVDPLFLLAALSKKMCTSIWHQTATIRLLSFRKGFITVQAMNDTLIFNFYEKIDNSLEKSLKTKPELTYTLTKKVTKKKPNIILKLIHSNSNEEEVEDGSEGMDSQTFALLFGDASLLLSKVLIAGLPDGCVYSLPLKCWSGNSGEKRERLLCNLNQPVVGVFLHNTLSDGNIRTSLLIIGSRGKAVLLQMAKGNFSASAAVKSCEFHLPGPIVSCDANKNVLLHSDGQCLWYTDLPTLLISVEKDNELCHKSQQIDIYDMKVVHLLRELASGMETEALLLHEIGKVYRMKLDLSRQSKPSHATQPTEDISTILHQIQQQTSDLAKYEGQLKQQNDVIANLSILSSFLLNEKVTSDFPTSCKVNHLPGSSESTFQISVTNKSVHKLQKGFWNISISLTIEDDDLDFSKKWKVHCFPLISDLESGQNADFVFPMKLTLTKDKWDLPLRLTITLQFLLPSHFVIEEDAITQEEVKPKDDNITAIFSAIELSSIIIDELYVLNNCFKGNSIIHLAEKPSAEAVLRELEKKRKRTLRLTKESSSALGTYKFQQQPIDHVIRISPKIVENIPLQDPGETDPCLKVMSFLKRDSEHHLLGEIKDTLDAGCTDMPLKLNISLEENLIAVRIRAHHLELFSRLRQAILRRFQAISTVSEDYESGQVVIPRSCLIQVNKLLTTLNSLPDDEEMIGHLLQLYLQLRNNVTPLLPII